MDVVLTLGREDTNFVDETKMSENIITTEETPEKLGGFDSRDRRKSKYLSSPYTNIGPKQKDMPSETEDLKTPCPSQKAGASNITTNSLNGSSSYAKLGSKRFRKSWHRKFISCNTMSSNPKFMNASTEELLSGLHSTAVDCMFPVGNKSFDLVERFFCRYRVSNYHDETELATFQVNAKEEKLGKPVGDDLPDTKSKKRKNKMENAVRRKRKSLSGLSDVNVNTSNGNSQMPGKKLKRKRKMEEVTSVHQPQNVEINLIGSCSEYSSIPQASQNLSCLASEGKVVHKQRETMEAQKHQSAQATSVYTDAKRRNCSSLVIDLPFTTPPIPVDIPKRIISENKEELVLLASNPELRASQEGPVESISDDSLSVNTKAEVGAVLVNKTGLNNSIGKETGVHLSTKLSVGVHLNTKHAVEKKGLKKNGMEKAAEKPLNLNTKLAVEIPDLNGTGAECNSINTEFDTVSFISPQFKSEEPSSLSACSRSTKTTTCNNRLDDNGESLGTCLLLKFAPVANIPSKEDLLTTFCRFGPLKASETQFLKDTGSAQVVFVRGADAAAAFHSLEPNKFAFGSTLVDCKLHHHLSAASPPVEQLVTPAQSTGFMPMPMPGGIPTQPNGSMAMPGVTPTQPSGSTAMPGETPTQPSGSMAMLGETPSLQTMKQTLQMMTSFLENSGTSLSPRMKAKLDYEIRNLMRKMNSSTKV